MPEPEGVSHAVPEPEGEPAYPARWEADAVLADGGTVHIRPIRPDDARGIEALFKRLSRETVYRRFFTPLSSLPPKLLERLVNVDYKDRLALVAELGEQIVAVARYDKLPSGWQGGDQAEVAFVVDDAHQGRGIATLLLEHLAAAAREAGVSRFVADTLPDNQAMLRVFRDAGFGDERRFGDGVVRVSFPIEATPESEAAIEQRDRRAAARSVGRLLNPSSVAVIGATPRPGALGNLLVRMLVAGDFNGPVYPVNPNASHVGGIAAYPSVLEVPGRVDLAVIVVPASAVEAVVQECARKHVASLVVISAGFAEKGPEGAAAERRLVSEARRNGMRLVGPNCMGVVNTDPEVRLDATFSPMPPRGRLGLVAQSGGLGVVLLDEVARRGLGISSFVSAGNRADVSGNDLLRYWEEDPATEVIAMYIESFGNPRTFARVARRVSRRKPIVVVKSLRTAAGTKAAGAHRRVEDDAAVDALFRHTGAIRTATLEELFDVAQVLGSQPLPPGRRVAIIGNAGGPGVLAADAALAAGLELAEPANGRNPAELAPDAGPEDFAKALGQALSDPAVDAAIVLYASPLAPSLGVVADAISSAGEASPGKPVVACALGRRGLVEAGAGRRAVPFFAFPEAASRALGATARYADWRRRPEGTVPELSGTDVESARGLVEAALSRKPEGLLLEVEEAARLLRCFGLDVLPAALARTVSEAVEAAEALGYPVALKAVPRADEPPLGPSSVRLGLQSKDAVSAAFEELVSLGEPAVLVQAMTETGVDVALEAVQDPAFGPLVTAGAGGRLGDRRGAREVRVAPLTDVDAAEVASAVLAGLGGKAALEDALVRLGRLAGDIPEVAWAELTPVIVTPSSAKVAGARLRLAPWTPRPELALRRLS